MFCCYRAPSGPKIKEELNLKIKKRSWYQPFCPTILKEDANKFVHEKELDRFMTMGYYLKDESIEKAKSVMNIDKSIRPQFLNDENPKYEKLLKQIKKETGNGIVLNTSFNIHGSPIVLSPEDAIKTQLHTKNKNMFIGNYHIKIK